MTSLHRHNAADPELEQLSRFTAQVVNRFGTITPRCAVILGSGWGDVAKEINILDSINYNAIKGLGETAVEGHKGVIHHCRIHDHSVLVFQGRYHWYEGRGWSPVIFPVILSQQLGADTLLLTNAAGAINPALKPGSLMVLSDHINLMGSNPLIGRHRPFLGPRFPDQSNIYPVALQEIMCRILAKQGLQPHRGTYLAVSGPTYETPAEIRAFAALGADVIGMSTVPEAIVGNAAGMQVAAMTCITNTAAGISQAHLDHKEVLRATAPSRDAMAIVVSSMLHQLCMTDHEKA